MIIIQRLKAFSLRLVALDSKLPAMKATPICYRDANGWFDYSAFKFMPVLGRYITDCFENKASQDIRHKWRLREASGVRNPIKGGDGSRGGPPLRVLTGAEMAKL